MFHTLQDGADYPYETLKYYCDLWEEQEIRKQKRNKFLKIFLLCAMVIGAITLIAYHWDNIAGNTEVIASLILLAVMCFLVFYAGYTRGMEKRKK